MLKNLIKSAIIEYSSEMFLFSFIIFISVIGYVTVVYEESKINN